MPTVIAKSAGLARILEHVRIAHEMASKRGGCVTDAATEHLTPSVAHANATEVAQQVALAAEAGGQAALDAAMAHSHAVVVAVNDEMWIALGRPARISMPMAKVYPGGLTTSKTDDTRAQPLLMGLLEARILAADAPEWSEDSRKAWAARVAAARVPLEAALKAHDPLFAEATMARADHRAAVHRALEALRAFKLALLTFGLTNKQIFEIIPDATPTGPKIPRGPRKRPTPSTPPADTTSAAPPDDREMTASGG